jgi:DNA-binding NarL/FixJ family response regulator
MDQRVRILLADDHDVVRTGIRAILEASGMQICAEANNGKDAVKLVAKTQPDIAVLDLELGELDGVTVTRQIKKHSPDTEVLIFTMHDNEYLIREALSAGARAFVSKSEGARSLIQAIECVRKHKPFFAARASETLLQSVRTSRSNDKEASPLTDREREVVQLLASGKSNKQAALSLGISVKTVETHRAAIMRKLGFSSIVKLVRYAVRERFIKA